MIKRGQLKQIDGLYGFVDIATQAEAERLTDTTNTDPRGIIVFIPFVPITQNDVDDSVEFISEEARRRKNDKD